MTKYDYNLPYFAKKRHLLKTEPEIKYQEDFELRDETEFEKEEHLDMFLAWMEHVHTSAYQAELEPEQIKEMYGLNIWSHKELYQLYLNRNKLPKFFMKLAEFEGKIMNNHRIDGKSSWRGDELFDKELD